MANQPVVIGRILSMPDITAWFNDNPFLPSTAEAHFPKVQNFKSQKWQTISNVSQPLNEAADHVSLNSPIPVSGRERFNSVIGEMAAFGKARDWDADKIEQFNELKIRFAELNNQTAANQLVDFYGADLSFLRNSILSFSFCFILFLKSLYFSFKDKEVIFVNFSMLIFLRISIGCLISFLVLNLNFFLAIFLVLFFTRVSSSILD